MLNINRVSVMVTKSTFTLQITHILIYRSLEIFWFNPQIFITPNILPMNIWAQAITRANQEYRQQRGAYNR